MGTFRAFAQGFEQIANAGKCFRCDGRCAQGFSRWQVYLGGESLGDCGKFGSAYVRGYTIACHPERGDTGTVRDLPSKSCRWESPRNLSLWLRIQATAKPKDGRCSLLQIYGCMEPAALCFLV